MYVENELKKIIEVGDLNIYRDGCIELLGKILNIFVEDKKMFEMDNFSVVYYDEYSLKTNCNTDIFSVLYLEIDQPSNFKPTPNKKKSNRITLPELFFDLSKFREELFNLFKVNLDSNYLIWYDECAVYIKATILENETTTKQFYFKIIPSIVYYNKNNVRGLMYKNNGGTEIEYPRISLDNFNKKNKNTKGKYRDAVNILKNILLKQKDITRLPKEIIEIVLYNVPNEMFVDTSKQSLINIINYLRNYNVKSFKTIDEQDEAFISPYRSLSPIYVKHILKLIEKYLATN